MLTDADRQKIIAFVYDLPDDAQLALSAHLLSRADFDRLPGENEQQMRSGAWTKDIAGENVSIDLFTNEPPATLSFPFTRKPDLRVVGA